MGAAAGERRRGLDEVERGGPLLLQGFPLVQVGVAEVSPRKQVLNARIIAAGATTVAKASCTGNSGSNRLVIPNADGWFCGVYLSGTGIAAATTVTDIDPSGTVVTLSANMTAAVNGTVTATYNNATVYYNVAHLNLPFAQGAIT